MLVDTCWDAARLGGHVPNLDDLFIAAIRAAGPKPPDDAPQAKKNPWVARLSNNLALALAQELRDRGMDGVLPAAPGETGVVSGAERRLAGGIGAKKVDVTWATEESGLILGMSVKTIMFRDAKSGHYQKNLTNRRGDMLIEAVTLHRRFPYAVLVGMLFMDVGALHDATDRRSSTFENAFPRFRLFTRRPDPAGREEQYELLYLLLVDPDENHPSVRAFEVNDSASEVSMERAVDHVMDLIAERNVDLYEVVEGRVRRL